MKSYTDHLKSLLSKSPSHFCNRASAIFPIFSDSNVSMKLIFLNYWEIKRSITHLLCRYCLRGQDGETLYKKCFYVENKRSYELSLNQMVSRRVPIGGSLEIEFSSPENLVFPYPAVVVVYEGKNFCTFVHSAQRTFNDERDEHVNARLFSIESGFNIYRDEHCHPFITFVNGSRAIEKSSIELAAYNTQQKVIGSRISLSMKAYETKYISLDYWKELAPHLNSKVGTMKIKLPSGSVFPRVIVGNRDKVSDALSVTHTYYDLVQSSEESDFWNAPTKSWQAAALMLPINYLSTFYTRVYFYPIYSPTPFEVDLEIYDLSGKLVKESRSILKIETPKFAYIDMQKELEGLLVDQRYSAKLIAWSESGKIPARIKVGFDVGSLKGGLPCNICTNFYPANPSLDKKKTAFRWAPLFAKGGAIFCLNDAPKVNYKKRAHSKLTFYRIQDEQVIEREITIEPRGSYVIERDSELKEFLGDKEGWCTLTSDNPYITTYYFEVHPSGSVGGDHGF